MFADFHLASFGSGVSIIPFKNGFDVMARAGELPIPSCQAKVILPNDSAGLEKKRSKLVAC